MRQPRGLYIQYTLPAAYPPLEHSSRILADDGWRVQFLGVGGGGGIQLAFPSHPNIKVRLLRFQPPGWRQKIQYAWFVLWCVWWCLMWRPQVVYCSDPWSAPVGVLVWYLLRVPVVYHEHDTPGPPTNRFLRTIGVARKLLARVASVCVIPNRDRLARFKAALQPRKAVCVWNCPTRDEVLSPKEHAPTDVLVLWYHGSLNASQFPPKLLDALPMLPDGVRVRFAGYETVGHPGFVQELLDRAERLGVRDRVEYLGTPPTRRELCALASTAHVGLALFAKSFREPMAGASNKPFDYLSCGLALLVTDTAEWADLISPAGCGRVVDPDSADAIATTVRYLYERPDETRAMGEAGRQRILSDWNYETRFEPVHRWLNAVVQRGTRG